MRVEPPSWLRVAEAKAIVSVAAQPGSKTTELVGLHDGALRVRIAAPALDGRGNAALCAWLAETLALAHRDVSVLRGEKSRRKQLVVAMSAEGVAAILEPLVDKAQNARPRA